ncbi:MAG: hypothetical protein IKI58_10790 [Oscillospiraceae bacterium]|nr:hypothetical protein [Oscillospiraceae bacterium]
MENSGPMWWMRRNTCSTGNKQDTCKQEHPVPPLPAPPPLPESAPDMHARNPSGISLQFLTERLRHSDSETLLLLGLIWLLYQDRADSKLLLALVYILL